MREWFGDGSHLPKTEGPGFVTSFGWQGLLTPMKRVEVKAMSRMTMGWDTWQDSHHLI